MKIKIVTDDPDELIEIKWDGERFALVYSAPRNWSTGRKVILLNPREAKGVADFIKEELKK